MAARAAGRESAAPTHVARVPEPGRSHDRRRVQTALKISNPGDAAEREAETTARLVMAMPNPAVTARERVSILAARAPTTAAAPKAKTDETSPELTAAIRSELGGGRPLPAETRKFMEPRFKASFAGVRIHTGGKAENLASRLGASAFTFGRDIFFNAGAFKPDSPQGMELIAHELTHTIQQREVVQRDVHVSQKTGPQVQRGLISRALDWVADKANNIPGFRLFTIVIGVNPINMSSVDRSGANILRALIEFIPGGGLIVTALENHGVFQRGGKFIEDQFRSLGMVGAAFRDALMEFLDSLGITDIARPGKVIDRAIAIFTAPVKKLISFGKGLVGGIAEIVKDVILKPLGRFAAANIPKWDLLVGVFGKNPISDEGESPASALIGAFMELIGQKEIWENIKKGNAVAKAWAWFQGAMKGALSLVTSIPGRVMGVIRSLTIFDIVTIAGAFAKVIAAFGSFVGDFMRWAGGTVLQLLEIILSVVAPTVIPYLKKAGGAFSSIIRNPIGFVRTLVRAGIQGFRQFASNFLTHLKASLIGWLTGALGGAGIYIPSGFTLIEILKFVLSVMGLTWANIRAKLVAATNETVVKALETGFDIVKTLVTEGPAAAWQKIVETLTNLKQMAIDAVMDFVKSKVVEAAVTKLLSMLNPAGAFIQAIIAIYNTIMFFVERIRQIAQVAAAFIDGIAAIAAGNIVPAAARVEQTMAGLLTLVISFLARIAGLGKVSDAVLGLVKKIRAPIDKALDKVVAWIVATARKLGKMLLGGDGKPAPAAAANDKGPISVVKQNSAAPLRDGEGHVVYGAVSNGVVSLTMASGTEERMDFVLSRLRTVCQKAMADYPAALKANPTRAAAVKETYDRLVDIINISRPQWQGAGSIYVAIRNISEGRVAPWDRKSFKEREAAAQEELRKYLSGISGTLTRSIKLGFISLAELKFNSAYVDAGGTLKPAYRDVRKNFYAVKWTGVATSAANGQLGALRAKALSINPALAKLPNPSRFYWSEDKTGTSGIAGYVADATDVANNGQPEYDHVTPLGTRWKSGGNNTNQPGRDADYQIDIQVISKRTNLSKSGPPFVPNVGPNFKGPKDV